MSKVSIIIPVYNADQYIDRCITSIINQTEADIEIIIVDDGSTDQSLPKCYQHQNTDSRMVVVHKSNEGPHSARKRGTQLAKSKWVAFIDADDWIEEDFIQSLLKVAEQHQVDLVAGGLCEDNGGVKTISRNQIPDGLYNETCIKHKVHEKMLCCDGQFNQNLIPSLCGKLFLKDKLLPIVEQLDNDIRVAEDLACTLAYVLKCNSIYVISEINGYRYCRMSNTLSHEYDADYFDKIGRLFRYFDTVLRGTEDKVVIESFNIYKIYLIYRQLIIIYNINDKEKGRKFCRDIAYAMHDATMKKPFQYCSINHLNIGFTTKILLFLFKMKYAFLFNVLCNLILYRNMVGNKNN